jgi:predicted Holliday junction resolvase-like endonuclease
VAVTALYARRRVTHPFTKAQVDAARAQSRMLSRSSRDGVGGENVAPWMPGFPYEPRDASFLGKPVDYVVFDGLDDGELREIVFVEVKTGQSGMTKRGQQIRRAVRDGRVSHRLVRLARTETEAVVRPASSVRPRRIAPRDDTTAA